MVVREEERDPVRLVDDPRRRLTPGTAVAAAIALAWLVAVAAELAGAASLLHHDALIEDGPPAWVALPVFLVAWQVMVAAMMLPSSLPLIRLFERTAARQPRPGAAMAAFLGGYALVWSAFGAAAFALDLGVHAAVDSSAWLERHAGLLGGSLLALAGAFQFSSLKDACLDKCRNPGHFLIRFYERGAGGGLRLGLRHGAFCLGCCWALMLVMFAVGVASVAWMALFAAVMVYEKTRPAGARSAPVTGVALLGAASVVLAYAVYAA